MCADHLDLHLLSHSFPTRRASCLFRRLAFGPGAPVPVRDHLAKWQQPIRAAFVDAPGDSERQAARQHLHDLAGITGIEITEASPASANLLVFFADDPVASARRHRSLRPEGWRGGKACVSTCRTRWSPYH